MNATRPVEEINTHHMRKEKKKEVSVNEDVQLFLEDWPLHIPNFNITEEISAATKMMQFPRALGLLPKMRKNLQ